MLRSLFASAPLRRWVSVSRRALVASPKKLAKCIEVPKSAAFLHKDVKLRRSKNFTAPSEQLLSELCERVVRSTTEGAAATSLQNFYYAFLERQGADQFRRFIERHEGKFPTLVYKAHFMDYLRSCSRVLKHDPQLLALFAACDWKQLSLEAIPKTITEDDFESERRDEQRLENCRAQLPAPNFLFSLYSDISADEDDTATITKPQFIQNEADIPLSSFSQGSDEQDSSGRQERSLAEFLKRQAPAQDQRPVMDSILILREIGRPQSTPSNFLYFQLESGDDSLLTRANVLKAFKTAGAKDIVEVYIMNKQITVADEQPDLDSFLEEARLTGSVDQEKLVDLSETTQRDSIFRNKQVLQDEALTGLSTASSEIEKDTSRIKGIYRFANSVPQRNRCYGFVEFRKAESKQDLLKTNYRLFGVELNGGLMATEDADMKRTLKVGNLPWGMSPPHFASYLNTLLRANGEGMSFDCPENFSLSLSDASYLYLELNDFHTAFRLCRLLNTETYRGRPLQVDFKRGCAKYLHGKMVENYSSTQQREQQKAHISQRTWKRHQTLDAALVNN